MPTVRSLTRRAASWLLVCAAGLAATAAPASAQIPAFRTYQYRGEPQRIDTRLDRLAVRFTADAAAPERQAFLERASALGDPDPELELGFANLAVLRLASPPRLVEGLERALHDLAQDPAVVAATPVYHANGADLIPTGQVFLQLRAGVPEEIVDEIRRDHELDLVRRTPWTDGNFVLSLRRGAALDAIALAEELGRRTDVEYCEPDFATQISLFEAPDDAMFPRQWNLHSTGQDSGGIKDGDIDAPEGWEVQQGQNSVRIAILDTGIQTNHPDLSAAMDLANGWDFVQNDNDPSSAPGEPYGYHGTMCSGVAGASTHNAIGIAGVAGGSRIIPIRIAFEGMITNAIAADGIGHAWMHQADAISCSWGLSSRSDQVDRSIREAVTRGRQGRGTVVCFAAGNDGGTTVAYPAILKDVIAVAATSPCDSLKTRTSCDGENWWASNHGAGLDVAAPGVLIRTTTIGGGYVENFNGTSSACPHVAGLAGLLIAKFPDYEGTEIRARIEQTCDRIGGYAYGDSGRSFELGYGRINMYRALSGKPQVIGGTMPNNPSIYRDVNDARGYPLAIHESAAYEWLGDETSPEVSPADTDDPDGAPNVNVRDAFDDGVFLTPPYIPGTQNQIRFQVSVEDHTSRRYVNKPLYLNCWVDWEADGNWTDAFDRVVTNVALQPSGWADDTETITIPIQVPDVQIGWHVQSGQPRRFLNVRTRLTYNATLMTATQLADWGEVEDHAILNFVEMFDEGTAYMTHQGSCDPWEWVGGASPWLNPACQPPFRPDSPMNGFMTACIYNPIYHGDANDMLRTPTFDLSELTQARLEFEFSAVEMAYGRVVVYVNGAPRATLRTYNGILTADQGPCKLVFPDAIDLTAYTGDGFSDVFIAFEVFHDEPCGIPLPTYQDWLIDNVVVVGVDAIRPAPITPTVTRTSNVQAELAWTTPGDDGSIRRADLYNIRYSPRVIDAQNWRHALWVRKNMTAGLPVPQQPGTPAALTVKGLESGLHHFCVRTLDEVNWIAPILDGGVNHAPSLSVPGIPDPGDGDTVRVTVTASDPDFDALFLGSANIPAGATFHDNGNSTGMFEWIIPPDGPIGSHTMTFSAEDWNGARDEETASIRVIPKNIAPDDSEHDDGAYVFTVTSHGSLGFLDATGASGSGFVYPKNGGANQLYIGGLWVGSDGGTVANRDYDADPRREWRTSIVPDGHMQAGAGGPANEEWIGSFTDNYADAPRGLLVEQRSWTYTAPEDDDFCIVRYRVTNRGAADLSGVHVGCFLDFDLRGEGYDDQGSTDAGRKLAWLTDASGIFTGVRMLDPGTGGAPLSNLTLVSNPTYVWPNGYILDADKDAFLRASDPQHVLIDGPNPDDYSILAAAGPFDLASGASREVAFAVIGATSRSRLEQSADRAQTLYGALASDVAEDAGAPASFELLPGTPNPFADHAVVAFRTQHAGAIRLEIHDVGGRRVRSLLSGSRLAGEHRIVWDGRDDAGHPVPSGSYFIRLAGADGTRSAALRRLR